MAQSAPDPFDRALGALAGGALGDALGMPTQMLSPTRIEASYGYVEDFREPASDHPVSRGLRAGTVTDDTEQTFLLGRVLLQSASGFDNGALVTALLAWEQAVRDRGGYDLLGPSTKRAIEAIRNGVPAEQAGRYGDTNGAAMRIAPVGIMIPPDPLDRLVGMVASTCRATHNTSIAISSASAVAAAVSCGIEGGDWRSASDLAVEAARCGAGEGNWVAGAQIADRIEWARGLVRGRGRQAALPLVIELVGTSVASQESIPAAFAILEIAGGDAWLAAVIGANLGGDTDTIGAIAAGIAGACSGLSALPSDKVAALRGFDMTEAEQLAAALLRRRLAQSGTGRAEDAA